MIVVMAGVCPVAAPRATGRPARAGGRRGGPPPRVNPCAGLRNACGAGRAPLRYSGGLGCAARVDGRG
jgi:hypothetical protein